ncbi:hypothetical protein BU24DRAFT_362219 [Aaosphaeria arxii CBS 175.79]|uniref:Zn(2)-C6 fungal-type domain-containing protein n=1 Tax=Aaosphaeria arxii CBS 175.79 TaxID=1450172 RepID=A0A6A5Y8L6_9PLEO|nr:uncharacterized protein BU24DRAFT_362219 [Aaosphaeria arxii CBS 175.79]KAF2021573.1 hypothetical protein BU24DRAFT_362219 [Aaosphaeria arxii CBS 175.79]
MDRSEITAPPSGLDRDRPMRVPRACQRCRQQKLKCDVERPCTLCVRAGVTCVASNQPVLWKVYGTNKPSKKPRSRDRTASPPQTRAKRMCPDPVRDEDSPISHLVAPSIDSTGTNDITSQGPDTPQDVNSPWVASSAAVQLMEEAFQQHNTVIPEGPETSSFSARRVSISTSRYNPTIPSGCGNARSTIDLSRPSSPAEAELLLLLPSFEPATVIIDNYFERIHWFMMVFHQCDFRDQFEILYRNLGRPSLGTQSSIGFLGVLAAVCVVSLSYLSHDQRSQLADHGIDPEILQKQLLMSLKMRLLDIVSQGSIEAVQACVLLGSFYLYHGEPSLAWPICGCGLRIAQALNLHRRCPQPENDPPDLDDRTRRTEESRKRCWWAVYEIETFCSMLYGFPLSINDDDCDMELLNPYPLRSGDPKWKPDVLKQTGQATLLTFKHSMVQLSIIVKCALVDLYGLRGSSEDKRKSVSDNQRLHTVISTVSKLSKRLEALCQIIPKRLRINESTVSDAALREAERARADHPIDYYNSPQFLFPLQGLILSLAFENARILIHRPLLSYRLISSAKQMNADGRSHTILSTDSYRSAIQTCKDAALKVSIISSLPIVKDAANTYAVSFVSMHVLTAAVTLSIITSLEPLSRDSYDCKMGIRRLMEMQSRLRSRSIVAEQGLSILKKLMSLVLAKEREQLLEFPSNTDPDHDKSDTFPNRRGCTEDNPPPDDSSDPVAALRQSQNAPHSDLGNVESPHTSLTYTSDGLTMDLYEDSTITQALHEFEQVINLPTESPESGAFLNMESGQWMGSCFNSQDQSWIWGSNYQL